MPGEFLSKVLEQSALIRELIRESAASLAASNTGMRRALADNKASPGLKTALDENEASTRTLLEVSARLTLINDALQVEIRDRTMVDYQLAAAVEQEEGARTAALHDNLTGLPNRVLFLDRLDHGIAQATRHRWILAVMFVDLNNFKTINDTYGHLAGDTVLQNVAQRLARNTRDEDTVSRYGGDEFLYLLTPLHEQKDIAVIAAKILREIQLPCDVRLADGVVNLSLEASIGISVFPKDGADAESLIERADAAMYAAKEAKSGFAFAP